MEDQYEELINKVDELQRDMSTGEYESFLQAIMDELAMRLEVLAEEKGDI